MFLVFMICLGICVGTYKLLYDFHNDNRKKEKAKKYGNDFWIDRYGNQIHTDSNVPFKVDLRNGDMVEYHPYTGKIIRNYSKEKRIEIYNIYKDAKYRATKNGDIYFPFLSGKRLLYRIKSTEYGYPRTVEFTTPTTFYGNVNNDRYYFGAGSTGETFYVDMETGIPEDIINPDQYNDKLLDMYTKYILDNKKIDYHYWMGVSFSKDKNGNNLINYGYIIKE